LIFKEDFMALIKCTECGKEVSDQAKACPQCGAKKFKPKPAKKPLGLFAWTMIAGFSVLAAVSSFLPKNTTQTPTQTPEQIAAKTKRDGQLETGALGAIALKNRMKDPEAFNLTGANVKDNGATCYEYRAKNGFGAIFPGSAVLTSKGDIYVSDQGDKFTRAWNRECAGKSGEDIKSKVRMMGVL
jgi:DNA-directed RNA polymerase subunit RPC12/RpoP